MDLSKVKLFCTNTQRLFDNSYYEAKGIINRLLYVLILGEKTSMSTKGKHVVPRQRGGWAVKTEGTSRASRIFETKSDAVKYARDSAKKMHGELYVHGKDGTIKERRSYGNTLCLVKDKK